MPGLEVRIAKTDDDTIAIHKFLCLVAGPTLPGPIDAKDSIQGVWRVVNFDVALMAMEGDVLVGTLGLCCPEFWWNSKIKFLANRWLFAVPGSRAWRPLLQEARAIGVSNDMEVHIYDEERGTLTILNKSKEREKSLVFRKFATDIKLDADHDASAVDDASGAE